ncbi:MAG: GDP-mannose dehydrogenase, partial [Anaerolineae bacterium]|nr:GDP-mannose dehydrogenase [Anaerolineae bacterium]
RVMEILCLDRRLNISPAYLKPGFAFGGSCLSKDLQAMITRARDVGYTADLLISTLRVNDRQIEKAHDLVRD